MKRNAARELAVQLLFANRFGEVELDSFLNDEYLKSLSEYNDLYVEDIDCKSLDYIKKIISQYSAHSETINNTISENSNNWDINRLSATALACLKCAITEILYFEDIPTGATINSIIDIAKKYDDSKTVSFINGVLGSISNSVCTNEQ